MKLLFAVIFLCLSANSVSSENKQAAIASAHPLATQAGFEILEQGGNAQGGIIPRPP